MSEIRIDCGPCVVRGWRRGDEPDLVAFGDDRRIWINMRDRFPHPYTFEEARDWIAYATLQDPPTDFAIAVDDRAVGGIGLDLKSDIERCSAEIGYWVASPFQGRGIATAAVRAVTEHAFAAHGLTRVYATAFVRNAASRRVLEKAGYVLEGIMRRSAIKDGVVEDQTIYAIVR